MSLFIVLEGIDGSGKSTLQAALGAELARLGHPVHTTAEPTLGPVGQVIRSVLETTSMDASNRSMAPNETEATMALLFAADRLDHLHREIEPALERGAVVLCDRYVMSSMAYQSVTLQKAWVADINRHARQPDFTLFCQIAPQLASQRRAQRGRARSRYESEAQQLQIAASFNEALHALPTDRYAILDASQPVETVCAAAIAALKPLLGGPI